MGGTLSKRTEVAESVVCVIDVISDIKRLEVVAFYHNEGAAGNRTKVWFQFINIWIVVVPIFNVILRVLLSVEGDREWLSLAHNV